MILLLQYTTEACPNCFWNWIAWMALSASLGLGLGRWIWGAYRAKNEATKKELAQTKAQQVETKKEIVLLKYQLEEVQKDNQGLRASLAELESITALKKEKITADDFSNLEENTTLQTLSVKETSLEIETPTLESATLEKISSNTQDTPNLSDNMDKKPSKEVDHKTLFKNSNLKIIEGINAEIERLLKKEGIDNWEKLTQASYAKLQDVLYDASPRLRMYDPKTWGEQAKLATENKWETLIEFQKALAMNTSNKRSKIERLVEKTP